MKIKASDFLNVPKDITLKVKGRVVEVKGPKGTLKKDLSHLRLDFRVNKKSGTFTAVRWFGNRLDLATIKTALSIVRNMITGVTETYRFKLRFAYAHFPINVTADKQTVEIRNFLGEKRVRRLVIPPTMKVFRTDMAKQKDELVLEGIDLQEVSQTAAKLHQLCKVPKKDIRKFLDGIYVQTKTTTTKDV